MPLPRSTFFKALLAAKPSAPAISGPSNSNVTSYSELLGSIVSVQRSLTSSVKAGDRVAVLCEKGIGYAAAFLGVWAAGGIVVPVCTSHPVPEILYTLTDSGSKVLLYSKKFESQSSELQKKISELKTVAIESLLSEGIKEDTEVSSDAFDETSGALIIYTSGTTGQPKGAVHTHKSTQSQMSSLKDAWKYTSSDRLLHVLPLHHIHGIVNAFLTPLYAQGCVEFADDKFSAAAVWQRLMQYDDDHHDHITLFMAVPTIYTKLLAQVPEPTAGTGTGTKLRHVRLCVSGSAALPSSVKEEWKSRTGHVLLERYGMTEIGMGLSCGLAEAERLDSSVGWPLPGVQAKLMDDSGKEVTAFDTPGEIWIAGDNLFAAYHGRREQTEKEIVVDGTTGVRWFKTGDVAIRSERHNGAYYIQGRSSVDIIKSGGYKISALEIERDMLRLLPYVREVSVLGIKDAEWGQRVAAVIVPQPATRGDGEGQGRDQGRGRDEGEEGDGDEEVTVQRVRDDMKKHVAAYKVPSIVKVVDEIKRNAMGKINKVELAKTFEQ